MNQKYVRYHCFKNKKYENVIRNKFKTCMYYIAKKVNCYEMYTKIIINLEIFKTIYIFISLR